MTPAPLVAELIKGFGYGSGLMSLDKTKFIINIPKNASSYMLDWASRHHWTAVRVGDASDWEKLEEMIVVLRDPTERWISGIAQYINTYILSVMGPNGPIFPGQPTTKYDWPMRAEHFIDQYNQNTERLIFDVINKFDDHVWPQCYFFEELLPGVPRKYFYLDTTFNQRIAQHLNFKLYNNLDLNSSISNDNMAELQTFFRQRFQIRPELKNRVINAYARDYALIDKVFNS
jgi:hypothetical protein